ncbi:MAG: PucR family transcriptional regulator [Actinobacteria bacterium]|nr:PucR family transcriptional regulator [Actinomycetota bacterium]
MTVAMALELPVLRRGLPQVVAGTEALDTPIRWVHAGEVPNMAAMLRGGELLLTTGMGIGGSASQRRFVAELASKGVAGLVIELGGSFTGALPATLVAAAAERRLPLIELHAEVRFVAVTEAVHTELVNRDYRLLRRAEELHRGFTRRMLAGEGVVAVLSQLAATLGNPVFLESADGRLLAHAAPPDSRGEDLLGVWAEAGESAEAVGASAAVPAGGSEGGGRLLALPLAAPFDPFTQLALERAAEIVALALLRSRQEDELLTLSRGDLFARLADGRIDPAAGAARAAEMGFGGRGVGGLVAVAARVVGPRRGSGAGGRAAVDASWIGSLRDLEREFRKLGAPTLVGVDPGGGDLVVLVGLRDRAEHAVTVDRVASILRQLPRPLGEIVVAAGAPGGWEEIGGGLRDAIEAAAVGGDLPPAPWHDATAMPLERLLWRLGDNEDLRRYVERVLGPLLAHDAGSRRQLLPTLEALVANGGGKAATARALTLNRQALYARIARIERILGVDLSASGALTAVELALRARRHLRGTG